MLGVTIKLDNYGGADERLIRVLDVAEGSPAAVAGLVKEKDFMLGTTTQNFNNTAILAAVLEENIDQVVEIYVYNADSDMVRVVALVPSSSWGGAGLLGAEVGTGYLHRLPNSCRSSIGQSVERKVRWTNAGSDAGVAAGNATIIEMEPHLEMEVEKDEITGHSSPEDGTRQPHELGRIEETVIPRPASEKPEEVAEISKVEETAVTASSSAGSSSHDEVKETTSDPNPSNENEADELFSEPPQMERSQIENPPTESSFLPPPPKMNY